MRKLFSTLFILTIIKVFAQKEIKTENVIRSIIVEKRVGTPDSSLTELTKQEFDSTGRLVKEIEYESQDNFKTIYKRHKYEYNSDGKLVEIFDTYREKPFSTLPSVTIEYNSFGKAFSIKEYAFPPEISFITLLNYDKNGNLIDSIRMTTDGGFHWIKKFYNKVNRLEEITYESLLSKGEPSGRTFFKYNTKGEILQKESIDKNGDHEVTKNKWKKNFLHLTTTKTKHGNQFYSQFVQFVYLKNLLSRQIFSDGREIVYKYDNRNNWVEKIVFDIDLKSFFKKYPNSVKKKSYTVKRIITYY